MPEKGVSGLKILQDHSKLAGVPPTVNLALRRPCHGWAASTQTLSSLASALTQGHRFQQGTTR